MPTVQCAVVSVAYKGGLIGMFTDNRKVLEKKIQEYNDEGFRLRSVLAAKVNVIDLIVQIICLTITLLIWAPARGETLVFERENAG